MLRWINWVSLGALVVLGFGLVAQEQRPRSSTYFVLGEEGVDSARLAEVVEQAGGTTLRVHPQIGVVVAASRDAHFAERATEAPEVAQVGVQVGRPRVSGANSSFGVAVVGPMVDEDAVNPPAGDDDDLFFLQWGLDAVNAPEAWELGATGAGVRVAVLDTGIHPGHVDLAANVNTDLCASFVPGEDWNVTTNPNPGITAFAHGTHVASIIAAADNGVGMIGVAPEAEIVAVKVLSQYTGYGTWDMVIDGILYAADIDADVINMSLGGEITRRGGWDDNGTPETDDDVWFSADQVAATVNALERAVQYARANGAVVVAAAGNAGVDGDHDADRLVLPAQLPGVLSISATAPHYWWDDPTGSLDYLASYSNYGQSEIDFAAPGGDLQSPAPFYGRDLVLGAVPLGWALFGGTSMASPHAAGVAALILGENPDLTPSEVEAVMRQSADDLGKPGRDDAYGYGRLNAYEAVR